MAGTDPDLRAALATKAAILAAAIPGIYGTVDTFSGNPDGFSPGEMVLNSLISAAPVITAGTGSLAGGFSTPGLKESGRRIAIDSEMQQALEHVEHMVERARQEGRPPTEAEAFAAHLSGRQMQEKYAVNDREIMEKARVLSERMKGADASTPERAAQLIRLAAGRRSAYGGLAGAVLGGIPAVMLMRDQEEGQQGA